MRSPEQDSWRADSEITLAASHTTRGLPSAARTVEGEPPNGVEGGGVGVQRRIARKSGPAYVDAAVGERDESGGAEVQANAGGIGRVPQDNHRLDDAAQFWFA
jgi:hypothetical protein